MHFNGMFIILSIEAVKFGLLRQLTGTENNRCMWDVTFMLVVTRSNKT